MTRRKTFQRGSVRLHNGNWTLRYRELDRTTGVWKTRRVVLGEFKNITAARSAAEPIMAQVNERNNNPKPPKHQSADTNITFKEFTETRWKGYMADKKHQPSSVAMRESLLRIHLLPFFGEVKMREVAPRHVESFFAKLPETYTDSTRMALYRLLRLLFDIAWQYDLIKKSPVRPKRHRPKLEKIIKPTLNAAQIQNVLQNLGDERDRLLVLLLAVTGLRVGEALALRWLDFNVEAGCLAINHTLYNGDIKKLKTEASQGTLKLHPVMTRLLLDSRKQSSFPADEDFIFCRRDGSPLNYRKILKRLHKAIEDSGITRERGKHGFHILRHSAGTLLYTKSRDLKLVQGTLRHSEVSTTSDIYVHLSNEVLQEGTEILTEVILANCDLFVTRKSEKVS